MSELSRRQFIGSVGSAAAITALGPDALAAAGSTAVGQSVAAATTSSPAASAPASPVYSSYQTEIYLDGLRGISPKITTNLSRLEARAARVLSPRAQKYFLADAGGRGTVSANARAFRKWRIVPLMFRDHAVRDLSTTVLGIRMPAPVLFAPVGRQRLAHPDGELASARAAADLDLTYIHSANASYSLEDVAIANGAGSRWYELSWPKKGGPEMSLLQRARAAQYTHLVIKLPSSDPSWRQLPSIRRNWDGPILLRGVRTVEDATRAVRYGFQGIVVSNHGGRKGDGSSGSLEALPAIARRTRRRLSILFDSGVRTAPDVFKALALGADAVLLGRPYVFGLALDGQAGVRHVMRTLLAELDISLGNAGYATHSDLGATSLSATR